VDDVRRVRFAQIHLIGNAVVIALAIASRILRVGDAAQAVVPWGIATSDAWTAALGVTDRSGPSSAPLPCWRRRG